MERIGRYGPPLALMVLIFVLSAQPDLSSGLGDWDFLLRKLAHMTEYGLLWFLLWRAGRYRRPLPAAGIAVAYAGTDEVHQAFVTGRHGTPVDVLIDTSGMVVAALLVHWRARGLRTRRREARAV